MKKIVCFEMLFGQPGLPQRHEIHHSASLSLQSHKVTTPIQAFWCRLSPSMQSQPPRSSTRLTSFKEIIFMSSRQRSLFRWVLQTLRTTPPTRRQAYSRHWSLFVRASELLCSGYWGKTSPYDPRNDEGVRWKKKMGQQATLPAG